MEFKMKPKSTLLGLHESSDIGTPVFMKDDLAEGCIAEANRDGTIFVKAGVTGKKLQKAIDHEMVHINQMRTGRLQYTDDSVTWKKDTKSPARVYERANMNEGHPDFEWEAEAYKKSE